MSFCVTFLPNWIAWPMVIIFLMGVVTLCWTGGLFIYWVLFRPRNFSLTWLTRDENEP